MSIRFLKSAAKLLLFADTCKKKHLKKAKCNLLVFCYLQTRVFEKCYFYADFGLFYLSKGDKIGSGRGSSA